MLYNVILLLALRIVFLDNDPFYLLKGTVSSDNKTMVSRPYCADILACDLFHLLFLVPGVQRYSI